MSYHVASKTRSSRLCITLSTELLLSCRQACPGESDATIIRRLLATSWRVGELNSVPWRDILGSRKRGTRPIVLRCFPSMAKQAIDDARENNVWLSEVIEAHCWRVLQ